MTNTSPYVINDDEHLREQFVLSHYLTLPKSKPSAWPAGKHIGLPRPGNVKGAVHHLLLMSPEGKYQKQGKRQPRPQPGAKPSGQTQTEAPKQNKSVSIKKTSHPPSTSKQNAHTIYKHPCGNQTHLFQNPSFELHRSAPPIHMLRGP